MNKNIATPALLCLLTLAACNRAANSNRDGNTFAQIEQAAAEDFGDNIAMPVYTNLQAAATDLNTKIEALNASPDNAKLDAEKTAWRNMPCNMGTIGGFLFGPVEDNDYDPQTDTWPIDYAQMDSLLASHNALQPEDVQLLDYTLRGYHPIEYMLWAKAVIKQQASLHHGSCNTYLP